MLMVAVRGTAVTSSTTTASAAVVTEVAVATAVVSVL